MIKGRKVYDPLTNTYSTGWWIVDDKGNYYPVWQKGAVMERLTDSNKEIPTLDDNAEYWLKVYFKLKDYEDLEEQGRLVKLPCKVEDTVYGISMGKIINLTVNEISIFCMKGEKIINVKCQSNDEFRNYVEREFGKTVFLTKEEAEAKLKELRGGENESSN